VTVNGTALVTLPAVAVINTVFVPVSFSVGEAGDELPPHPVKLLAATIIRSSEHSNRPRVAVLRSVATSNSGTDINTIAHPFTELNPAVVVRTLPEIVNVVLAIPPSVTVLLAGEKLHVMPAGRPEHA